MTVTNNQPEKISGDSWRFSFTSDQTTPTYSVYWTGLLVNRSTSAEQRIVAEGEPVVEVYDSSSTVPAQWTYPGRVKLQWRNVTGAEGYRVDEYVSAVWTSRGYIGDVGTGYYQWQSRWLEDVTSHTFRVVPLDQDRNDGTPQSFTVFVVRNPDTPAVTLSYGSGTLTIAAS